MCYHLHLCCLRLPAHAEQYNRAVCSHIQYLRCIFLKTRKLFLVHFPSFEKFIRKWYNSLDRIQQKAAWEARKLLLIFSDKLICTWTGRKSPLHWFHFLLWNAITHPEITRMNWDVFYNIQPEKREHTIYTQTWHAQGHVHRQAHKET